MLKFLILVATIAYASAAAVPNGVLPQLDGRIVDGHPTSVSTFPWQISLQRGGRHSCGGSVVNERVIVTAAHCLYGANVTTLRVRAGSSLWFSGGSYVSVAAYTIHEKYSPSTMVNDVAVMRLSDPLKFSSTIKPIKLAQITPANGTLAVVSGWGTTKSGSDTAPSQLKAVNMDIVSREVCDSDIYGYGGEILPSMICTYSVGKDSCQGDSGGPLVSGGVLVGIVSWGYGCALTNLPGVYADVAELHGWLNKTINAI